MWNIVKRTIEKKYKNGNHMVAIAFVSHRLQSAYAHINWARWTSPGREREQRTTRQNITCLSTVWRTYVRRQTRARERCALFQKPTRWQLCMFRHWQAKAVVCTVHAEVWYVLPTTAVRSWRKIRNAKRPNENKPQTNFPSPRFVSLHFFFCRSLP